MAPHSSTLAWRIPWTEEPGRLQSMGREESDTTEWFHSPFSLSCIGEENGNPLQCSCLENPRDGGAWWAAVYGVAQSRTRLKRLSSSRSSPGHCPDSQLLILQWCHVVKVYAKMLQPVLEDQTLAIHSVPQSRLSLWSQGLPPYPTPAPRCWRRDLCETFTCPSSCLVLQFYWQLSQPLKMI